MLPISRLLLKHGILLQIKLPCFHGMAFSVGRGGVGEFNTTETLTHTAGLEQKCIE